MTIAEQLKKKRKELGLSQEYVADKVGLSRRALAYYEAGERIPNAEVLFLLCDFYAIDIKNLVFQNIDIGNTESVVDSKEIITKIDEYLRVEKAKKESFKKGVFNVALILSIIITIFSLVLVALKFVLMSRYGFSFSDATAEMWTALFEALIKFVNDPAVKFLPILSIVIVSLIIIGWAIYFLIKLINKHNNKWTKMHNLERIYT